MAFDPSLSSFSIVDYLVFAVILIGSLGIGVYHCIRSNKTTEDFLLASRSMSPAPVALSLLATYISSIAILGYPGEVYGNGIQLIWSLIGLFFGKILAIYVFMPVIYPLQLSSINEYLELRFRSPVLKRCVSMLSCINYMLYLGMCLYAPTLALEAVTPLKSSTYILILGIIVTLYSSSGGLKAVVWTDAFQCVMMVLGVVIATVSALVTVGGFGEAWRIASEHGRIGPVHLGLDLHTRHTVFNTILMNTVQFINIYSFTQSTLQRVATMPNFNKVKQILQFNFFGLLAILLLLYLNGITLFAVYADCDPISMGYIERKDQILPYFIMDHLGYMKGIPGAFVACLFRGTMSSASSVLNAVPAMLWTDFLSHIKYFVTAPEQIKTLTNKLVTFFLGLIMIGLAFLSSRLSGLIQATTAVMSVLSGPIVGVYLMGICMPFCGKKGAFTGLFSSIVFMTWLSIGSLLYGMKVTMLPLSTDRCENTTLFEDHDVLSTTTIFEEHPAFDVLDHPLAGFYGISYTFLMPLGIIVCVVVGIVVSLASGSEKLEKLDPAHVLPILRKYVGSQLPSHEEVEKSLLKTADADVKFISSVSKL